VYNRKGFSLIELLVVMSISGLLLFLSFPALSAFKDRLSLETRARQLAFTLRKAQSLAISRGETQIVGRFKFSKTGSPLPGGFGTEKITSPGGRTKKVIVSPLGRVRIE
jgi:prepilin-type N-terminal cleavage/methylation domain-containing protein